MKKTSIALAVAAASLIGSAAHAAPQDDTWYTGAKLGWSQYHDTGFYDNRVYKTNNHRNQLGAGAYVGYQLNPYVGFEAAYDWLGYMPYRSDIRGNTGSYRANGIQLNIKLDYPIMEDLDIYTRLGGMAWRADVKTNGTEGYFRDHHYGVSPLAAVGLEYALTKSIATRLDYQWVNNIGDGDSIRTRPDNLTLSVGLAYRFGQEAPVVPVAAPVLETKRFALKSDILFPFNKAVLTSEGENILNELFVQLKNLHPTGGSSVVIGYADRIGSENYNLKLSEERAKTIVNYLISKGIPADKINARGLGEADSITGDRCDKITARKALIECLAPDRRVEIEITGVHEVVSQING